MWDGRFLSMSAIKVTVCGEEVVEIHTHTRKTTERGEIYTHTNKRQERTVKEVHEGGCATSNVRFLNMRGIEVTACGEKEDTYA